MNNMHGMRGSIYDQGPVAPLRGPTFVQGQPEAAALAAALRGGAFESPPSLDNSALVAALRGMAKDNRADPSKGWNTSVQPAGVPNEIPAWATSVKRPQMMYDFGSIPGGA